VQCKKETSWRLTRASLHSRRVEKAALQSEKELPMELTATITAIMAIMSFGFLAAVILGMI
jgi:hypothetical protein